jgi:kynurenine formamidase
MQIFDVIDPITEGMWSYDSSISPVRIETLSSIDRPTGWLAHKLELTTLTGTYLEASAHLIPGGETIAEIDPVRFICPVTVLQLPDCPPCYAITRHDLEATGIVLSPGQAVLFATGWDRMWNETDYVSSSPFLSEDAMEYLVISGASLIGGDIPTFDNVLNPTGVNHRLFEARCLLLAPTRIFTSNSARESPYPDCFTTPDRESLRNT